MKSNIKIVQRIETEKSDDDGKPIVIVGAKTVDILLNGDNAIINEILGYLNEHYIVE